MKQSQSHVEEKEEKWTEEKEEKLTKENNLAAASIAFQRDES